MKKDSQDKDLVIHHSAREKAKEKARKESSIKFKKFFEELKEKKALEEKLKGNYTIPESLLKDTITDETEIREIEPIVKINDANFAVRGDFSIVGGLPKVGKTTICAYMIATGLMKDIPEGFDSLGIVTTYCKGKPIVYFDTEQPKSYTNKLRLQIKKLLGVDKQPENLYIVHLRQYNSKDKAQIIFDWMQRAPDTHLWIIDGVADLIQDPNNTEQAFQIIERIMMETDRLNTSVILHLHENPGGGKLRGNLGSEAERKCGGAIAIRKKDGIHSIAPKVIRGSEDFNTIYFQWNKMIKGFKTCDEIQRQLIEEKTDPKILKMESLKRMARAITNNGDKTLSYSEACEKILSNFKAIEGDERSKRTAENRLKEMQDLGIIEKKGKDSYIYSN